MRELLSWYYGGRAPERLALLKVPLMCVNADMQPTQAEADQGDRARLTSCACCRGAAIS